MLINKDLIISDKNKSLETVIDDIDSLKSNQWKIAQFGKSSNQAVNNSAYNYVTWQNKSGDTSVLTLQSDNYTLKINDDFRYVILYWMVNTSANTQLYFKALKNGGEYTNYWVNQISFHQRILVVPCKRNDTFSLQCYSTASCNINNSNGTAWTVIGVK